MIYRLVFWIIASLGLIINIHLKGGGIKQGSDLINVIFLTTSILAIFSIVYILEFVRNKYITSFVAFIFCLAFFYQKRVGAFLSYGLFYNHSDYLLSWAGLKQIFDIIHHTFFASDLTNSIFFTLLVFVSHYFKIPRNFNTKPETRYAFLCMAIVLIVAFVQPYSHDPITNFGRSIRNFYFPKINALESLSKNKSHLFTEFVHSQFTQKKNPHIFLILIESFNGRFISANNGAGIEYTPFVNQLVKDNLYLSHYHSNSVYTAKGQFAALCGQVPLITGTEFKKNFQKKCLPQILKEHGYQNIFFQADPNFQNDNTENFMLKNGFHKMPKLVDSCAKEPCYGLGIRDDHFYKRIFLHLNQTSPASQPQFITIATVSSHMPFSYLSDNEKTIYKKPKNLKENYLNTLKTVDDSLAVFFELLKNSDYADNSIVIITGDHAFPTGEHGSFHNENYAYQENFVVPLIVYHPTNLLKKKFTHLEKLTFSHLNLGATILDLAGVTTNTDFIAKSIFAHTTHDIVYLVQPYSGGYYSVIQWPYKYIFSAFREQEWIYNLEQDKNEITPLDVTANPALIEHLRNQAAQMFTQQDLFKCDKALSPLELF